jgi:hypothetical protein
MAFVTRSARKMYPDEDDKGGPGSYLGLSDYKAKYT